MGALAVKYVYGGVVMTLAEIIADLQLVCRGRQDLVDRYLQGFLLTAKPAEVE